MAVYGYLRNSTQDQAESPKVQRGEINKYCKREGLSVDAWFHDDGISGGATLDKRPALGDLLTHLKRGDVLVVAKRDRLARDSFFSAWIDKEAKVRHFTIVSADGNGNEDNPDAKLMRQIVAAFSEYELELIRWRTRKALQAKRKRGERVGTIPYGFRLAKDGKTLKPDPKQQQVINKTIVPMYKRKPVIRRIVQYLNDNGILAPTKGKKWNAVTVKNIIQRAQESAYAGAFER